MKHDRPKIPDVRSTARTVDINLKLGGGALALLLGLELSSWQGYGWQVLGGFLVFSSVVLGGEALKLWRHELRKQSEIKKFFESIEVGARWLTLDDLERAGMLEGQKVLGALDGHLIYEPPQATHSIVVSANGGGKSTCMALPTIMSIAHQISRGAQMGCVVVDGKDGELAHQAAPMLDELGIDYAILDDQDQFPDHPRVVAMNPLGGLAHAHRADPRSFGDVLDRVAHTLCPSVKGDGRNEYFYRSPRERLTIPLRFFLQERGQVYPGLVWAAMSSPDDWAKLLELSITSNDAALRAEASKVLEYMAKKQEHEPSHVGAALAALSPFAAGRWLHDVGSGREGKPLLEHQEVMRRPLIVFITGRYESVQSSANYFGLHVQAMLQAQMREPAWIVHYIAEEAANVPLREIAEKMQVLRGKGARIHIITQSRAALESAYGERETRQIFNEAVIKQYLMVTDAEEAEKLSRAIGDQVIIRLNKSLNDDNLSTQSGYAITRERLITPEALLSMPRSEQIVHIGGLGWLKCQKVHCSELGPYRLGRNPVEDKEAVVNHNFFLK